MVENALGIFASRFRILLDTTEQRPKVARDIVYVVLRNMLGSHQGEQRDRKLQWTTNNHHRMTRRSRDER